MGSWAAMGGFLWGFFSGHCETQGVGKIDEKGGSAKKAMNNGVM
jgi:hypothetical protein